MSRKTIYLEDAIEAICKACSMETDYHRCDGYQEDSTWCDSLVALRGLPSAQSDTSRIENALHGKSAEEQYDFIWWLITTDMRSAVIEWLRGERNDDTISRQAAIDAVKDVGVSIIDGCESRYIPEVGEVIDYTPKVSAILRFNKEVRARLRDLSRVQEQRWIPVTEKYPDMDERVLVYTTYHDYHVWDCMSNRGEGYFWEDEDGLFHNKYEVTAWMPLPEPYKDKTDE